MMVTETPVRLVRTSERGDFMRCKQRWYWGYVQGLKSKNQAPALEFGTLVHGALEAFYKPQTKASWKQNGPVRGPHPAKTFRKLYAENLHNLRIRQEDESWVDAEELGSEMLTNYVKLYGKDEQFRVVAPEKTFAVDLHDEDGEYVFTYVGTLDVVVQDMMTQQYGIVDHKTAAGLAHEHLSMDEQASSYWAMTPYVWPKLNIDFMMFNILRKGKEDTRPKNDLGQSLNKDGTVSKKQSPPLFARHLVYRSDEDRRSLMQRAILQVREMQMYEDGRLTVYKSPLNGCVGMFSCQFRDMCELHEGGSDWESFRDAMMTTWDPYASHGEEKGR